MDFFIEVITIAGILFPIVDPLGNVFPVQSILDREAREIRSKIIYRETLFATLILVLALFCGGPLFAYLNINEMALKITGGVLLFMIAITMVFPKSGHTHANIQDDEAQHPFIVPIAIPFIAGPSAISVVILMKGQYPYISILVAIILLMALVLFILMMGTPIVKFLGQKGAMAVERLMGLLLVTIAVQMLLSGVTDMALDIKHRVDTTPAVSHAQQTPSSNAPVQGQP